MTGITTGLTLTGTGTGTESGAIGSSLTTSALASLTKSNTGMWTLSNNVFNKGTLTVQGGTLEAANSSALYVGATGSWTKTNIIVKNSGSTLAFGVGTGGFSSANMDTLVTNLVAGGTAAGGFETGTAIGFDTTGGNFSFGGGSDPLITNNSVGGVIGLTKLGANTLTLAAANTYTGVTTISGGNLNVGVAETAGTSGPMGDSAAANPGSILFNGGTLQYSSANHNDYSGRFSTTANQPISIDTNGQTVTFATALQGSGTTLTLNDTAVTKGSLTLSATNTYSGATNINGGTLILAGTGNIATSATSVNSTGVLGGTGLAGALTLNDGGAIAPGAGGSDTTGRLSAASLVWNAVSSSSSLTFNLDGASQNSTNLNLSGAFNQGSTGSALTINLTDNGTITGAGDYDLVNFTNTNFTSTSQFTLNSALSYSAGLTGSLVLNAGQLDFDVVAAVPEPGTWALMLGGLALLVFVRIHRHETTLN
jgi:autotransporter-associated beta strand protein